MHMPTRRDISTTGTITAMSKIDLVFLFFFLSEQYVSLLFEHTGLPTNLVTQLNDKIKNQMKRSQLLYKL
jgi:hypothetical protein